MWIQKKSIVLYEDSWPTRSRGISRNSEPCFKKTLPAVCCGFIPIPSSVMMAVVAGSTLNSSAANFTTAVNGILPNTLNLWAFQRQTNNKVINFHQGIRHRDLYTQMHMHTFTYTLNGNFGSDVNVTLNLTFASSSLILNGTILRLNRNKCKNC